MIISFNGLDGSGKSTQIENIYKKYYSNGVLINSFSFPKKVNSNCEKSFHEWWFKESSVDEFCTTMYSGIKQRIENINDNEVVYLIDKGISNFDARIYATLRIKGLNREESLSAIKKYKIKYGIFDIEEIKILIINDKKNNNKEHDSNYNSGQIDLYKKYRKYQEEFIAELENHNYYTFVYRMDGSIDSLSKNIYDDIENFGVKYKFNGKTIRIDELNAPDKEKRIIADLMDYSKKVLKNDLSGFLVHGSISRNVYIPKWSDIDILLFVHKYDCMKLSLINQFIKQYDIKIGITTFSDYEISNNLLDAKSLYSIYSLNSCKISSLIYAKKLFLPNLSIHDLKEKNKQVIPESIHKLKRLLYRDIDNSNFKEIYKLLTLVMKVDLINRHNIISKSYYQTFYNFSYIYNLDFADVEEFLIKNNCKLLKDYGMKVVNIISNGGY